MLDNLYKYNKNRSRAQSIQTKMMKKKSQITKANLLSDYFTLSQLITFDLLKIIPLLFVVSTSVLNLSLPKKMKRS